MGKDQVWIEAEDEKEMVLRQAEKKFHKWFNMYLLKYLSALIHGQSSIDEIKQHIQEEEFIRIIRDPDMLSSDLKTVIAKISFLPADWKAITH